MFQSIIPLLLQFGAPNSWMVKLNQNQSENLIQIESCELLTVILF